MAMQTSLVVLADPTGTAVLVAHNEYLWQPDTYRITEREEVTFDPAEPLNWAYAALGHIDQRL